MISDEKYERMKPILKRRTKDRELFDRYGDLIDKERNRAPTNKERIAIRRILKMGPHAKFPKCRNRDYHKAESLDRKNGLSLEDIRAGKGFHTKEGHVCSECRCSHTAGSGTKGNWYWQAGWNGFGEVGHFGVGPCFFHSPYYSLRMGGAQLDRYRENIMSEIEAVQQHGMAPDGSGGYLPQMREAARVAQIRTDTRTALYALNELANETITKLMEYEKSKSTKEDAIKEICEVFGLSPQMIGQDEKEQLWEIINKRPMTEMARGSRVPMCDKTIIELKRALLNDVGKMAQAVFNVHEDDYTHNDEVTRLLTRFYEEAEATFRSRVGEEDWCRFMSALRDIGRKITDNTFKQEAIDV